MLQLLTALAAVAACLAATERQRSALAALLRTLAAVISACKGACAAVPHLTASPHCRLWASAYPACVRAQSSRGLSSQQQRTLGRWLRPSATASSCKESLRAACIAKYIWVSPTCLSSVLWHKLDVPSASCTRRSQGPHTLCFYSRRALLRPGICYGVAGGVA